MIKEFATATALGTVLLLGSLANGAAFFSATPDGKVPGSNGLWNISTFWIDTSSTGEILNSFSTVTHFKPGAGNTLSANYQLGTMGLNYSFTSGATASLPPALTSALNFGDLTQLDGTGTITAGVVANAGSHFTPRKLTSVGNSPAAGSSELYTITYSNGTITGLTENLISTVGGSTIQSTVSLAGNLSQFSYSNVVTNNGEPVSMGGSLDISGKTATVGSSVASVVPEPGTAVLLLMGGGMMLLKRFRARTKV